MTKLLKNILFLLLTFATMQSEAAKMSSLQEFRFGRFSIQVPTLSVVSINASYLGVDVIGPSQKETLEDFRKRSESEAAHFNGAQMRVNSRQRELYESGGVNPDAVFGQKQLVYSNFDTSLAEAYLAYHPKSNTSLTTFRLSKMTPIGTFSFEQENGIATEVNTAFSQLRKSAENFKAYETPKNIPQHAFCVQNGCFDDHGRQAEREKAVFIAKLGRIPDTEFSVSTNARTRSDQDYNDLEAQAESEIHTLEKSAGTVSMLRHGSRTIVGQSGYEIGVVIKPADQPPNYIFVWASAGVLHDPLKPIIDVDLRIMPDKIKSGTITTSEEAESLWDSLVQTLQLR
ncbi:T6SS immunity protein Tli4 family protein [Robbsia andropogonis]|uniref:T6SS immunity protein Tli4 family protein n=1 Tax=Robbsia andropogonis TaxID=28092 RepID=UPI0004675C5E|nr:T6SS immunity protein Tli4 family protein [Robbsia andropogonis]